MGVPSLYRWITNRYPDIKRPIKRDSRFYVDNLYLDFNAIIHPCCNKEFRNMEQTEEQLYINLSNYVDHVMELMQPHKLVYIAVDGVAPRAKLNQQRSRRFVSAKEAAEKGLEYFDDINTADPADFGMGKRPEVGADEKRKTFNVNAISPGTKFMDRLDGFIKELIKAKLSEDYRWRGLSVIYSSYHIPGEGEQKIMEYIRKHQRPNARHVIYSPDADLIFLGLTLQDYNVFIMREEFKWEPDDGKERPEPTEVIQRDYGSKEFVVVDIPKLRFQLVRDFKVAARGRLDERAFLQDWVFMCFMVGNDFLPTAPCFEIKTNAIDKITSILLTVYRIKGRTITNGRKIDYDVLKAFFIECAAREDGFLVEKSKNLLLSRTRMKLPYDEKLEFPIHTEAGKIRFYIEKMGISSEAALLEACTEYIKGCEWVYNYYFYDIISWDWYYPYHFAPFMADLALVSNIKVDFRLGKPLRPLEQLLAVLPAQSKALLPACLWDIFEINKEMYPTEFAIDGFQKCMEWQAVPILPFVDVAVLRQEYAKRQDLISFEDAERNAIGYPILFTCSPQAAAKAETLYQGSRPFEYLTNNAFTGRVFPCSAAKPLGEVVQAYGLKYVNKTFVFSFDQRFQGSGKQK